MKCEIILNKDSQKNIDFIIYNLLFARKNYCFTTDRLYEEVRVYDAEISKEVVQRKINTLVDQGLIRQKLDAYCIS